MQVPRERALGHLQGMEATMTEPNASIATFDLSLTSSDGVALGARMFEPREARASVIVHGATATPARYYDRFATWLAHRGYRVLTYDYRGIGRSRTGRLGHDATSMRDWAERDAVAAHEALSAREAGAQRLLIAHSFGGQALGLAEPLHDVRGAAMVGVQLGYVGHWPAAGRARLGVVWNVLVPGFSRTIGYVPGWTGMGEDLPGGVAREWARWCTSPGYLLDHIEGARERFARFAAPTLFYSFTDDDYAPRAAVEAYLGALSGAPVSHRRFAPSELGQREIGHFGFFRPRLEPTLWRELACHFDDVLAGRPSSLGSRASRAGLRPSEGDIALDLAYGRD